MLPSDNIAIILFDIITGAVLVVACFYRCVFAPDSAIYSILLLVVLGGVWVSFIKLIIGLLISI